MRFSRGIWWIIFAAGAIALSIKPAYTHHGGLALEEEEGEETGTEATQWQQEVLVHGYRVKFLSYPKVPEVNEAARLVFEVQSADTGLYLSDLKAELQIKGPTGRKEDLPAPAVAGVPGYYEGKHRFPRAGVYKIMFRAQGESKALVGEFTERVGSIQELANPQYVLLGNGAVALASAITLVGAMLSLRRRLMGC